MAYPPIPLLPSPPLITDEPAEFDTKAFTWVGALENWTASANSAGEYIDTTAGEVEADALAASNAATSASNSETAALGYRNEAEQFRNDAEAAAGDAAQIVHAPGSGCRMRRGRRMRRMRAILTQRVVRRLRRITLFSAATTRVLRRLTPSPIYRNVWGPQSVKL